MFHAVHLRDGKFLAKLNANPMLRRKLANADDSEREEILNALSESRDAFLDRQKRFREELRHKWASKLANHYTRNLQGPDPRCNLN